MSRWLALALPLVLSFTSIRVQAAVEANCTVPDGSGLKFEILDVDDLKKDNTLWKIYDASFPANERWMPEVFYDYNQPEKHGIMLRLTEKSTTVGFAEFILLSHVPVSYLAYIAVDRSRQHLGYGSKIFQCVQKESSLRYESRGKAPWGLVWEIEISEDGSPSPTVFSFYKKQGAEILLKDYFMPPLRDGEEMVKMNLMSFPLSKSQNPHLFVNQIRSALYREIYPYYWGIEGSVLFGRYLPKSTGELEEEKSPEPIH